MSQSSQQQYKDSQQLNIHHSCLYHLEILNFRIKSIIKYGKKNL